MGTSAFDSLWDGPGPPKKKKATAVASTPTASAFDAAWDTQASPPAGDTGAGMTDLLKEGGILPGADPATRRQFDYRSGALQKRNEAATARDKAMDEQAMRDATPRSVKALGTVASLARDIPGGEFLQTGARSIFRQQPLAESFGDIRTAGDAAPAVARNAARIAGGTIAALAMRKLPGAGSVAQQGMKFGALSAATSADPSKGIRERGNDAAMQGALGVIAGKATEGASNLFRVGKAKSLGAVSESREGARTAASRLNYGAAEAEGAASTATPKALTDALEHPRVKPFADMLRNSEEFANASDATLARETYKLMGREQRGLLDRMKAAGGYDAKLDLEASNIGSAKERLLNATGASGEITHTNVSPALETARSPAPDIRTALREHQARPGVAAARREGTVAQQKAREGLERHGAENVVSPSLRGAPSPREFTETIEIPSVMPSFRGAVKTHAEHSGELSAFQEGADDASRIARGTRVPGKKLATRSPEAIQKKLAALSQGKAKAATEGVLGEAKNNVGLSPNPLTGFGVGKSAVRVNRLAPYLQTLDETTGGDPVANLLRALGISSAGANR